MSDDLPVSIKGKSGIKKEIQIYKGYPYILFTSEIYEPGDKFTLTSDDGAYKEELYFGQSQKKDGYVVLWFPPPVKGKKYSLKAEHLNASEGILMKEYFIFQDEILTLIDDEEAGEEKLFLRGNK